jgi:hypothetical protein
MVTTLRWGAEKRLKVGEESFIEKMEAPNTFH